MNVTLLKVLQSTIGNWTKKPEKQFLFSKSGNFFVRNEAFSKRKDSANKHQYSMDQDEPLRDNIGFILPTDFLV